jgi:hypothetical protein
VLCGKEKIEVSIDKTTDASGRKVPKVVIEVLKDSQTVSEK